MPYKVYASLHEDISSGWVWIGGFEGSQRSIVKITNEKNKKAIFCEALKIDENFLKKYKEGNTANIETIGNTLVANEWYRNKLDITSTQEDIALTIKSTNQFIGRFRASIQHPQIIVRLAIWLGFISVFLGLISIGIAICSQ